MSEWKSERKWLSCELKKVDKLEWLSLAPNTKDAWSSQSKEQWLKDIIKLPKPPPQGKYIQLQLIECIFQDVFL